MCSSDLIHRGTALSTGCVKGDEIMCPYHGWQFDSSGTCTRIPQLEDPTRIPPKAAIPAYNTTERYGLIWVALQKPDHDLPEIGEFTDPAWTWVTCGPYEWNAHASRQLENFTDFGHFPWVHPGLLGDPERPVVPTYDVATDGHIVRYDIVRPEATNTDDFPVFATQHTCKTARGRIVETATNEPINICGIYVAAGDYAIADASGVVFIRAADIERVLEAAEAIWDREDLMAKDLRSGKRISEVMGTNYETMLQRKA